MAQDFKTRPWTIEVSGLVNKPRTYDIDELMKRFPPEERIYRLRCVEAWSMVIPWSGFALDKLLKAVEPTAKRNTCTSSASLIPSKCRGNPVPSTLGRTGGSAPRRSHARSHAHGNRPVWQRVAAQNGAPLRVVVPWKYGFKSAKGIVKIELVAEQPRTLWSDAAPSEYGFYSNVNPEVSHPRWSQASERRIGDSGRRPTLMFNGYADQVASLYTGMDLRTNY